ncbi:phosphoribosylamine--glycine ligase [Virgibacillus kimchii]
MKILVAGSGGREHSMVMKLAESANVTEIYAAPGNGGMAKDAVCVTIDEMDIDGLVAFAKEKEIDLTIIGPEAPLNEGVANRFHEEGLRIFAPTKEAALLEGSKSFAKEFMKKYDIPTAGYEAFTSIDEAKDYIEEMGAPIVVKADGLAAGKGVVVAETKEQAHQAVEDMLVSKAFAEAGAKVVIEEFLDGKEFSLMAFVHENNVYPMVTARDHKRAYDDDEGPNTGGMGAYAPVEDITEAHLNFAIDHILQKTVEGMILEGRPFTGILYAGLIMTEDGPKVIEFNTRFGDPETQVVLPLMKNNLEQVMLDVLDGKNPELEWEDQAAVGVVVASKGYPGKYKKGIAIPDLAPADSAYVVHAGTKQSEEGPVSTGGRVLLVGAKASDRNKAAGMVYETLKPYQNRNEFFFRKDIGVKE